MNYIDGSKHGVGSDSHSNVYWDSTNQYHYCGDS